MRRELRFRTFDDARAELQRLEGAPVVTTGQWSYFQILSHCAWALEGSMKGVSRDMSWWKRYFAGPFAFRRTAKVGWIQPGIGSPRSPATAERTEGDEKEALSRLRKAMGDFEKFEGDLSDHPRFGRMDKVQWARFHAMHLANHLGWAKSQDQL